MMAVVQRMSIAIEARRLIRQARRVNLMAASWRGERLCLPCRFHLCRIPVWAFRAAGVVALAVDLFVLHQFVAF